MVYLKRKCMLACLEKGENKFMKKEALLPIIGKPVIVRDVFGNISYGTLESVDDETMMLLVNAKKGTKEIVSLQYISSVVIEEK